MRIEITVVSLTIAAAFAVAAPIGPVYPPPGGVTFSDNGAAPGTASGRTNFYTGLNSSAYDELFWGVVSIDNPRYYTQAPNGQMTFSSFSDGIAYWNSTANIVFPTTFGTVDAPTRFLLQFEPYTGAHTGDGGAFYTPTTKGAEAIAGNASEPVLDVTGTEFSAWFQYQIWTGSTWTPLLPYFDAQQTQGGAVATSSSFGFWYTEVPEPSSVALMAAGIGLIALGRHRLVRSRM